MAQSPLNNVITIDDERIKRARSAQRDLLPAVDRL